MTSEERHTKWLRFHRFQQSREKFFAPKINAVLREQYLTFIEAYKTTTDSQALLSISSEPIVKVLRSLYLDAAITYGAKIRADLVKQGIKHTLTNVPEIKARMPIGFNERMAQLIKDYFLTDILNTSENITETTRQLIQKILIDAYDEGLGIDEIIDQLRDTELSRIRARMIARTETVTAANQGAMYAAKDTGLMMNKEWLATQDARTRHDHRFIDGHVVGYDDEFILPGNIQMSQPGDRTQPDGLPTPAREIVNCRCTILFQPVRDSKGNLIRA